MNYRTFGVLAALLLVFATACTREGNETSNDTAPQSSSGDNAAVLFGEQTPRTPVDPETVQLVEELGMLAFSHKVEADTFMRPALTVETRSLEDFSGSLLVVNFWATWCAPCREEMPSMQDLYDAMEGQQFDMLAVNVLETREVAAAFVEELGLTFPVVLDEDGGLAREFGVRGFPSTYLIDAEGYIIGVRAGFHDWSEPDVIAAMQDLVAIGPPAEQR